jgi:calcineurin-like phosphoesterase
LKLLFVGDVVGKPGRKALSMLEKIIGREKIDFTVVNIENAAGGFGVTAELFADLTKLPIDVFTSGNHIWDKKDIVPLLDDLRTCSAPQTTAGTPAGLGRAGDAPQDPMGCSTSGQVFMANTDSPFGWGHLLDRSGPDLKVVVVTSTRRRRPRNRPSAGGSTDGFPWSSARTRTSRRRTLAFCRREPLTRETRA